MNRSLSWGLSSISLRKMPNGCRRKTNYWLLFPAYDCRDLLSHLQLDESWRAEWIPRDANAEADALSVAAWEEHTGKVFPHRHRS